MSVRTKFFSLHAECDDKDGHSHVVTVVGKLEQTRKKVERKEIVQIETNPNCFVNGELKYNEKKLSRKLTLGASICHPTDEFDEEKGIKLAKSRIEHGQSLGSIETSNVTMLTDDAVMGEILVKLTYICNNIDKYI